MTHVEISENIKQEMPNKQNKNNKNRKLKKQPYIYMYHLQTTENQRTLKAS